MYVSFRDVKPSAVIQDGVLVFEGEFAVPQLSAVSHVQASATLLHLMRPAEALRQAQLAQALAPDDFRTEVEMGTRSPPTVSSAKRDDNTSVPLPSRKRWTDRGRESGSR